MTKKHTPNTPKNEIPEQYRERLEKAWAAREAMTPADRAARKKSRITDATNRAAYYVEQALKLTETAARNGHITYDELSRFRAVFGRWVARAEGIQITTERVAATLPGQRRKRVLPDALAF